MPSQWHQAQIEHSVSLFLTLHIRLVTITSFSNDRCVHTCTCSSTLHLVCVCRANIHLSNFISLAIHILIIYYFCSCMNQDFCGSILTSAVSFQVIYSHSLLWQPTSLHCITSYQLCVITSSHVACFCDLIMSSLLWHFFPLK